MGAEPNRVEYNVQLQGKSTQKVNSFLTSLKLNLCKTVTNEWIIFIKTRCCKGLQRCWPVAEANQTPAHSSALHFPGGSHTQNLLLFSPIADLVQFSRLLHPRILMLKCAALNNVRRARRDRLSQLQKAVNTEALRFLFLLDCPLVPTCYQGCE